MALLTVIDVLMMVVGGVGIIYQAGLMSFAARCC